MCNHKRVWEMCHCSNSTPDARGFEQKVREEKLSSGFEPFAVDDGKIYFKRLKPCEECEKETKGFPCPHGRLPHDGEDGWKHCPHCLGLNKDRQVASSPSVPDSEWNNGDQSVNDAIKKANKTWLTIKLICNQPSAKSIA